MWLPGLFPCSLAQFLARDLKSVIAWTSSLTRELKVGKKSEIDLVDWRAEM